MSTENLMGQEAVEKLKDMVDKIDMGMMGTYQEGSEFIYAVPMSRQEVDEQGNIWYLLSSESETYQNLEKNKNVSILFSDTSNFNFLSLNGQAEISQDQARIEKYWNKMIEVWFEKGKEDPRIRVLKVVPSEAHYWDNKTNKLVTMFKVLSSAVTGQKLDIGREGELNV
ncbi:pyridoxamine 5'-phosphate oxidase family protein [Moheibacter stercoris]|uniref:General stress protein 26 n=1 Tax=Moheibacter stercoris TaxID=1628251 RepID=A0ABV2LRW4_9FLAO